jgi:hypothetical protein
MSNGYVNVPVVTDSQTLIQNALNNVATTLPGWIPREGNLEVLLLEEFANMVSEAATVASNVPDTIFQYFGQLVGITPNMGTQAEIYTTWTLINVAPTGGVVIPAGTVAGFYYQGTAYQYQLEADLTFSAGSSTSTNVKMQAVYVGSAYNIAANAVTSGGVNSLYLALATPNSLVSNLLVTDSSFTNTGLIAGVDAESDTAYMNRLSAELALLAPRPITATDYAQLSQNVTGVFRALSIDGFNPYTNLMTATDANPIATNNYVNIGDGTHTPTSSVSAAGLTVTTPATMPTSTTLATSATVGATSLVVSVAVLANSSSSNYIVEIVDPTNGNEIVVVTAVTTTAWTIAGGLKYAHSSGVTMTPLVGVRFPLVNSLSANSNYYQASAIVKCGTDTTATATPILISQVTYSSNDVIVYSSLPQTSAALYDYTAFTKAIYTSIPAYELTSNSSLAPLGSSTYSVVKPEITQVQNYLVFQNAGTSKTHIMSYAALNQTNFDFAGGESPTSTQDDYNFVPDSSLAAYGLSNGNGSSWTLGSGLNALPGYGIQFAGTGSATGSNIDATSPVFNLSNTYQSNYTVYAVIDTTYASAVTISLAVINAATGATLATVNAPTAGINPAIATFSISSGTDVYVRVRFGSGLNVPLNSSVVVSAVGLFYNSLSSTTISSGYYKPGPYWTPGGLYSINTFNYPRIVTVAPIDSNGLAVNTTTAKSLNAYLAAYREANFTVNSITPNYVPIDITWSAVALPGYSTTLLKTNGEAAIRSFLSPANWAGGANSPPYWDFSQNQIHLLDVAGIISQVPGISNVTSITMTITGGTLLNADVAMPGVAPLPIANAVYGNVYPNSTNGSLGGV